MVGEKKEELRSGFCPAVGKEFPEVKQKVGGGDQQPVKECVYQPVPVDGQEGKEKNDQAVEEKTADFSLFLAVVYRCRLKHEITNQVCK